MPERRPHDFAADLAAAMKAALTIPTLDQWSRRVADAPGLSLDVCPECGSDVLADLDSLRARCSSCSWAGVVLRRLP